jgi:V8-like Glu-specific endopeptidase
MTNRRLLAVFAAATLALPGAAQFTDDRPLAPPVAFSRDSGPLANPSDRQRSIHTEIVRMPTAEWLRVYFGAVKLGRGSVLRITSTKDGEVQLLDAETLAIWSNTSAYFNGDTITIEMLGGPETQENHLIIERLAYGSSEPGPNTLCGADDRVPTSEDWSGRVLPNGCTGAVWSDTSCILGAGHCFDQPTDAQVIEFRVPLNDAQCEWQHPPVSDQFPILTRQYSDLGAGNDWAVATVGPNDLLQKPVDRYGEFRPISHGIPTTEAPVEVTGYGVAAECELNQVQQTSEGNLTGVTANAVQHNADTTGGNSGSAIVHDGEIIAVHTHGGCPSNQGTRVDRFTFASARVEVCVGTTGFVKLDRSAYRCAAQVGIEVQDSSLIGEGSQDVFASSNSEAAPETAELDEVLAGVFIGTISTILAPPADAGDGQLTVAHGDTITVSYFDADGGEGGAGIERVATASVDCVAPLIQNVLADSVTPVGARISWTTDEPSSSSTNYGQTIFLGSTLSDPSLVTSHALRLGGLEPCTQYFYVVHSTDLAGNVAHDDNAGAFHTFTTACPTPPAVPDGSGPTEPLRLEPIGGNIRLTWDNRCPASGPTKVIYGGLGGVSELSVAGAICDIDPSATNADWPNQLLGSYWFLIVKDDETGVEGSWGLASSGQRSAPQAGEVCGAIASNPSATCP